MLSGAAPRKFSLVKREVPGDDMSSSPLSTLRFQRTITDKRTVQNFPSPVKKSIIFDPGGGNLAFFAVKMGISSKVPITEMK
jgi:hypothetical protein